MPKRRRIVPDASVMVPAFFPEALEIDGRSTPLTPRARRFEAAIRSREVVAFAPGLLLHEFTKRAFQKTSGRSGTPVVSLDKVCVLVMDFLSLPITYVPMTEIADSAWELMATRSIPPPDSWYLACAMQYDAELWISHEHRDGVVQHARSAHEKVFLLTERGFHDPH